MKKAGRNEALRALQTWKMVWYLLSLYKQWGQGVLFCFAVFMMGSILEVYLHSKLGLYLFGGTCAPLKNQSQENATDSPSFHAFPLESDLGENVFSIFH